MADREQRRTGDPRRQQLARIHLAKKALALEDECYRAVLRRVTGKSSAALMDSAERQAIIAEFVRLGFTDARAQRHQRAFPGKPATTGQVPMLRKVEALLADAGRPWEYARATAQRMFAVERLEWLSAGQLHRLVAALQVDANRRKD